MLFIYFSGLNFIPISDFNILFFFPPKGNLLAFFKKFFFKNQPLQNYAHPHPRVQRPNSSKQIISRIFFPLPSPWKRAVITMTTLSPCERSDLSFIKNKMKSDEMVRSERFGVFPCVDISHIVHIRVCVRVARWLFHVP